MKKKRKSTEQGICPLRNPVAKFASQFNKTQFFKDKTKYQRNSKHKGKEPFPIRLTFILLEKASLVLTTVGFILETINNLLKISLFCRYLVKKNIYLDKTVLFRQNYST